MSVDIIIATRNDNAIRLNRSLEPLSELILSKNIIVYVVNDSDQSLLPNSLPAHLSSAINVVSTDARLGLAHALNVGISEGFSEFIGRLDVGDQSAPERFFEQMWFLQKHPAVGLVGLKSSLIYRNLAGETIKSAVSQGPLKNTQIIGSMRRNNPFVHGSIMFRRACFRAVGGYDESLLVAQDFGLYMKFYRLGFQLEIIQGPRHSHDFFEGSSNTLIRNKLSRWNAMKLRLKYFSFNDYLSISFILFFMKDVILILFPSSLTSWLKRGLSR